VPIQAPRSGFLSAPGQRQPISDSPIAGPGANRKRGRRFRINLLFDHGNRQSLEGPMRGSQRWAGVVSKLLGSSRAEYRLRKSRRCLADVVEVLLDLLLESFQKFRRVLLGGSAQGERENAATTARYARAPNSSNRRSRSCRTCTSTLALRKCRRPCGKCNPDPSATRVSARRAWSTAPLSGQTLRPSRACCRCRR